MPGLIIVPLLLPRRAQVLWAVGTYSTAVSRYASVLFLGALVACCSPLQPTCFLLCNLQCFCSFFGGGSLPSVLQSGDRPTHSTYSTHSRFYGTEHIFATCTCRSDDDLVYLRYIYRYHR